jgi:hypothetical protein
VEIAPRGERIKQDFRDLPFHDSPRDSQKIRQIEIARIASTETLAGQYHSVFKGQGMNFDEVRECSPAMTCVRLIGMSPRA